MKTNQVLAYVFLFFLSAEAAQTQPSDSPSNEAQHPYSALNHITVPRVDRKDATVAEVFAFMSEESKRLDQRGAGYNFILNDPIDKRMSLDLREIPLGELLVYVTTLAGLEANISGQNVYLNKLQNVPNPPGLAADSSPEAELLRKAAQGDAQARFQVGVALMQAKDYSEALRYLKLAAQQKHANAIALVGEFYAQGWGIPQNDKEAVQWWKKSADLKNPIAQRRLGDAYSLGAGVARDPKQALYWYQLSANQGDLHGQYILGYAYASGYGVTKNPQEAIRWFIKAADQGQAQAQSKLGFLYLTGLMVEQDRTKGIALLRAAAAQGDEEAKAELTKAGLSIE